MIANHRTWRRRRNKAFENDDLSWAREMLPGASSPYVVEMAFHKARIACMDVSDKKRRESIKWLADRGLGDALGRPVRHDDPLSK